jgi:hypothetical protein
VTATIRATTTRSNESARGCAATQTSSRASIAKVMGERPWVQVVVVWGHFDEQPVNGDRVTFIHGNAIADWLRQQPDRLTPPATQRSQQRSGLRTLQTTLAEQRPLTPWPAISRWARASVWPSARSGTGAALRRCPLAGRTELAAHTRLWSSWAQCASPGGRMPRRCKVTLLGSSG